LKSPEKKVKKKSRIDEKPHWGFKKARKGPGKLPGPESKTVMKVKREKKGEEEERGAR